MELNEYQDLAMSTAIFDRGSRKVAKKGNSIHIQFLLDLNYLSLKLNGEAGEIAEEVAKALRDDDGIFDDNRELRIIKELGDLLWYVAVLAKQFNTSLEEVAQFNVTKLQSRQERDVLGGSGSDR